MQTTSTGIAAGVPAVKLEFAYDTRGRRIAKRSYRAESVEGSETPQWSLNQSRVFVYDDWNMIAEFDVTTSASSPELVRRCVWGLDLTGTVQGAGGVGGLLLLTETDTATGATHHLAPCYDGNGNITALAEPTLSGTTSRLAARYRYSAFGQLLSEESTAQAAHNPYRFSTKYTDEETGLLYYGHRYYDSETGRWLNRDPIEERGGINLYVFVDNRVIENIDLLGRESSHYTKTIPMSATYSYPIRDRNSGLVIGTQYHTIKKNAIVEWDCDHSKAFLSGEFVHWEGENPDDNLQGLAFSIFFINVSAYDNLELDRIGSWPTENPLTEHVSLKVVWKATMGVGLGLTWDFIGWDTPNLEEEEIADSKEIELTCSCKK